MSTRRFRSCLPCYIMVPFCSFRNFWSFDLGPIPMLSSMYLTNSQQQTHINTLPLFGASSFYGRPCSVNNKSLTTDRVVLDLFQNDIHGIFSRGVVESVSLKFMLGFLLTVFAFQKTWFCLQGNKKITSLSQWPTFKLLGISEYIFKYREKTVQSLNLRLFHGLKWLSETLMKLSIPFVLMMFDSLVLIILYICDISLKNATLRDPTTETENADGT